MTARLPARKRQIAVAIEAARAVGLHVVGLDVRQDGVRVVTAGEPLTPPPAKPSPMPDKAPGEDEWDDALEVRS